MQFRRDSISPFHVLFLKLTAVFLVPLAFLLELCTSARLGKMRLVCEKRANSIYVGGIKKAENLA